MSVSNVYLNNQLIASTGATFLGFYFIKTSSSVCSAADAAMQQMSMPSNVHSLVNNSMQGPHGPLRGVPVR